MSRTEKKVSSTTQTESCSPPKTNTDDTYSEDENTDVHSEDDVSNEETKQLLKRLDVLSKLITGGYRQLESAIVDTIDALLQLNVITEEEYQSLIVALYRCL